MKLDHRPARAGCAANAPGKRTPFHLAVLLGAFWLPLCLFAQDVFRRPNIEAAQRAMQERYLRWTATARANGLALTGFPEKIVWPSLASGEQPGDFPEDCFYDKELIDPETHEINYTLLCYLVADLVNKVDSYLPGDEFIRPDYVDQIDGKPVFQGTNPYNGNLTYGSYGFAVVNPPEFPGTFVAPWNYDQFFSVVADNILLKSHPLFRIYSTDSSGQVDRGGLESGGMGDGSSCTEAQSAALADFKPLSDTRTRGLLLGRTDRIDAYDVGGAMQWEAVTQTWGGRYGFDHSAVGELGGRAQVVLLVLDYILYSDGTPSSAGGAPGDEYRTYVIDSIDLASGGKYFTGYYGADPSFVSSCGSGTTRFGYSLAPYVVASPNFREQIGAYFASCSTCTTCNDSCPPGGQTTFNHGSIDYRVPLGSDRDGSAGTASIYSETADFLMASPFGLNLQTSKEATVLRDASYSSIPRQIVLPQGLVDIEVLSPFKSYVMKFYDAAHRGSVAGGYYQPVAGTEYKTITVENPGLNARVISGTLNLSTSNYQIYAPSHGLTTGNYYVMRIDAGSGPLPTGYTIGQLERTKLYYVYALSSNVLALLYFDSSGQAYLDGFEQAVSGQTLRISSPFPFSNLVITEATGSLTRSFDYIYTPPASGKDASTVIETNGARVRASFITTDASDPANPVEESWEEDGAGHVITKSRRQYHVFPWNDPAAFDKTERRELVAEIRDPSEAALTTSYSYYEDSAADGANYSRLKQVLRPDGAWERYEYDSLGKAIRTYSSFMDAAPTSDEAACRVVERSSAAGASLADMDGDGRPEILQQTVERVLGNEVSRTYRLTWSRVDASGRQRVSAIRCLEPGAAWNAVSNVTSDVWTYVNGDFTGMIAKSKSEAGLLTVYTYSWDSTSAQKTTTVVTGVPSADGESVVDGTKVVTVSNAAGVPIDATTTDLVLAIVLAHEYTPSSYFDEVGRATRVYSLDGLFTKTVRQDCCGTVTTTDKAGNSSTEYKDLSGYVYKRVHNGIAETFAEGYDSDAGDGVSGFTRSQYRTPRGGTTATLISVETYDPAGRLIAQLDPRDGVNRLTRFAESVGSDARWHRSVVTPDGTTEETVFYRDGSLRELRKAGTLRRQQLSGVESDSHDGKAFFARTTKVVNVGEGDSQMEWTKTYADPLGRSYKTELPDANGAAAGIFDWRSFDSRGHLTKQIDPDGVPTLFRYNARGELTHSAIDLNRNDEIDFSGADRIQRQQREILIVPDRGDVVRVTTGAWRDLSADAETIVSVEDVSTDGLQSWSTRYGRTTHTTTAYAGSGVVETTSELPDGTVQTVRRSGDFTTLQKISHPTAGVLSHSTYVPDGLDRLASAKNDLTGAVTTFSYFDNDRVHTQTRTAGELSQTTEYLYDAMDRVITVVLPDTARAETRYNSDGLVRATYGAGTVPVEYTYDRQGRVASIVTWQAFDDVAGAGVSGAAHTTFSYDARGRLQQKRDEAGKGASYSYTAGGRLRTRDSARIGADGVSPIRTTYVYGPAGATDDAVESGDLFGIYYSNDPAATPAVIRTPDRLGRPETIADASGRRQLQYDEDQLAHETYLDDLDPATADPFAGYTLERAFDNLHRYAGVQLTNPGGASAYQVVYGHDDASRLSNATFNGHAVAYAYHPAGVTRIAMEYRNGVGVFLSVAQNFDAFDRLTSRINTAVRPTSTSYLYDLQNRRTRGTREDGANWNYGYDVRGQLTSGVKKALDGAVVPEMEFGYAFDDIGNRTSATRSGLMTGYQANLLNQYTEIAEPRIVEVRGSASADATVTVNGGAPARRDGDLFSDEVDFAGDLTAGWKDIEVKGVLSGGGVNGSDRIAIERRQAYLPPSPTILSHDADGNLLADGKWVYMWDAENRLIAMETHPDAVGSNGPVSATERKRLEFTYDSQSRRIAKKVSTWDGSVWALASHTLFVYDGWNVIAELDASSALTLTRAYVWGLDLSGSLQGAGGVGGLLLVNGGSSTYAPTYDGNGNIIGLVSAADGSLSAEFEYEPFGKVVVAIGSAANVCPFGFSTKYQDGEGGVYYYGRRYYVPALGRWLSRDPAEEAGGLNLYAAFANSPVIHFDPIGERSQPFDWHHNYPQTFRWFFESKGMKIDEKAFGVMLLWPDHQAFKNQFQAEWSKFIYSEAGKKADKACVIEHFKAVIRPKFAAEYAKSVKAEVSHGEWKRMVPADKLKLVSPRFSKLVKAAAAFGTVAQLAQGAEWLNSADRAAAMIELVNAMEKSGSDRALEIYIWTESHLPGIAKVAAGKITADLADKPPIPADVADRLRAGFLATLEEDEP